jgi:Uma2 family endonuclease
MVTGLRKLTVQDYHRMAASDIFAPGERVELLAGQLYQMVAKGTVHRTAMTRIARLLPGKLA